MQDVNTWLIVLDKAVIPLLVLFLTPVLSALANRAIAAIQEKTKIELSKQQVETLDQMLHEAIHFAEEQAYKAIRDKTEMNGSTKMEKAIHYLHTKGKLLQLEDIGEAKADDLAELIEAKLFQKRLDTNEPTIASPLDA